MAYVDTSVLVAYYCPEPLSQKAESFLTTDAQPTISALTEVELFSAVSKKVRTKEIRRKDAGRVAARFLADIEKGYYTYLPVEATYYRLARDWIGIFHLSLRTLDALHLAISSSEGLEIVTTDPGLFKSARALSLKAIFLQ
ncbi:MAG TPA: type II toxin-antitoxin system VapC family toxin [Methylomirabilota bacterium]|nr:type II toxin-antitoxin system VapC family toxin [Methylomirabilota bacterium]